MSAATAAKPSPPPLPELRQDVVITLPSRHQYQARASRVTSEEIVLVLLLDARNPLTPGEVASMAIEYGGPRGLVRLEGRATVVTYDLVRFRLDGAADVVQRRDFVRVRVVRPLAVAVLGDDEDAAPSEWVQTLTVNVSGNGLLAAGWPGADECSVGDAVAFRLTPAEGEPAIAGRGRIARLGDDGQRGIAIEEIDADSRRQLVRFIFEQERIARQRTRDGEL
ncbi:MAG TPA: PilZ domain-containing protein [Conexibacter sp.]|nr:PilZ domain-containing protein [Conexibacter sp.]